MSTVKLIFIKKGKVIRSYQLSTQIEFSVQYGTDRTTFSIIVICLLQQVVNRKHAYTYSAYRKSCTVVLLVPIPTVDLILDTE